jgi:hypothetical protein
MGYWEKSWWGSGTYHYHDDGYFDSSYCNYVVKYNTKSGNKLLADSTVSMEELCKWKFDIRVSDIAYQEFSTELYKNNLRVGFADFKFSAKRDYSDGDIIIVDNEVKFWDTSSDRISKLNRITVGRICNILGVSEEELQEFLRKILKDWCMRKVEKILPRENNFLRPKPEPS